MTENKEKWKGEREGRWQALGKVETTQVERLQRKTQHERNMRGMRHEQL